MADTHEITDEELETAIKRRVAEGAIPRRIAQLTDKYVPHGKNAPNAGNPNRSDPRDIPQSSRREYLTKLEKL